MYKLQRVKGSKIKPFKSYHKWRKEIIPIAKKKHPKRPDFQRGMYSYKKYKEVKQIQYINQLSVLATVKYMEYSRHQRKIKKTVIEQEVKKLRDLKNKTGKRAYTEEAIEVIIEHKSALGIIENVEKSLSYTRKDLGYIKTVKGKVIDMITKRTYTEAGYNRSIQLRKYWSKVHAIHDSLGLEISVIRHDMKLYGDDFYEGLYYIVETDISPVIASPEELREYWKDVKALAGKDNISIKKARTYIKNNPVSYVNRLK